ncbi:MAG TPA: CpsD/CapB family tyrosine-protein kinase [Candidatus Dormibacteraeota bacterium]|jgi:protein-tyrosine kinase|nr:CpsD/CapB family tyrosine-protein kinase [Candidatus Dormibacteraeota bacterium]
MSRIHEALKKAAEERSAQTAGRTVSDLVDLSGQEAVIDSARTSVEKPAAAPVRQKVDPAVAQFQEFTKRCTPVTWKIEPSASVFSAHMSHQAGAEKFRTLRSRLYQIASAQPLKKILITSSTPAEGKTFVAANLAQSFIRQTDRRVLLIDSDLRASRLHLHLGAPEKPGLSDYLRGDCDEFQVTQIGTGGNLCLIPGGSDISNPSELLHSDRMKQLLDRMSLVFDWIILDSPPALAVHDASILADMCDGVLFVVRAGATDFELAAKASSEFHEKNLLGVVLNRVEKNDSYGEYYYGYGSEKEAELRS